MDAIAVGDTSKATTSKTRPASSSASGPQAAADNERRASRAVDAGRPLVDERVRGPAVPRHRVAPGGGGDVERLEESDGIDVAHVVAPSLPRRPRVWRMHGARGAAMLPPMRHHLSIAAAVSLALLAAIPAAAAVRSEHTLTLKLSAKTPKKSTGVDDHDPPAPLVRPPPARPPRCSSRRSSSRAARRERSSTPPPRGAAASRRCRPRAPPAARPAARIGGGTAAALTGTPFDPVRQQVAVYATTTGLAAILTGLQTAALPLKVKDNKITAVLPRICRPPGTAANGCATGDIVLKELDIKLDAKTKGSGSKAKRLITTPATCVGGKWSRRARPTPSPTATPRCARAARPAAAR